LLKIVILKIIRIRPKQNLATSKNKFTNEFKLQPTIN
jgi:hypothetical protein